uniref:Uncharacterized protein n=1 Tax=viral metagenome TaxID=1070528 RepID=A0A6M3XG64_9ZZZZ
MIAFARTRRRPEPALPAEPQPGDFVVVFLRPANRRVSGVFVRLARDFGQRWYVIRETAGAVETWISFQSITWPVRVLRVGTPQLIEESES